jgi:hypothetical protein
MRLWSAHSPFSLPPLPAKFAGLKTARFANAIFGPAKNADPSVDVNAPTNLNLKFKGLIVRRIGSYLASATDLAA